MKNDQTPYPHISLNTQGDALILRGLLPALYIPAENVQGHLACPDEVNPTKISQRIVVQYIEALLAMGAGFAEPVDAPPPFNAYFALEFRLPNGVYTSYFDTNAVNLIAHEWSTRYLVMLTNARFHVVLGNHEATAVLRALGIPVKGAGDSGIHAKQCSAESYLPILAAASRKLAC